MKFHMNCRQKTSGTLKKGTARFLSAKIILKKSSDENLNAADDCSRRNTRYETQEEPFPVEGVIVICLGHIFSSRDQPPFGMAEPDRIDDQCVKEKEFKKKYDCQKPAPNEVW